jgi:hypothetical protein
MPTRVRDLLDTNLNNLDSNKNKHILKYNATDEKIVVVSTDDKLSDSIETSTPEKFLRTVESELGPIPRFFNGGSF